VNKKYDLRTSIRPFVERLFIVSIAVSLFCGRSNARKPAAPSPAEDAGKIEVRNNAASLLANLLGDEKNVSKILIIKHNSPELGRLIKSISTTAGDGAKELEALAKSDPTLNLHALQLPPGEVATRAAISKTKEHELIFSSGEKFELSLLLSQTDALDYASHLAKIAAENSSSPEQQRKFHSLEVALNTRFREVVAKLRALPGQ
jgi:hypothetical protein